MFNSRNTGNPSTKTPMLYNYTSDDDDDVSNSGIKPEIEDEMAKLKARELATAFTSTCLRFSDAVNILTFSKEQYSKISNKKQALSTIENLLPPADHVTQVNNFYCQAQVCQALSKGGEALIEKIHFSLEIAESYMNLAAKDLIQYYQSLGPKAQTFAQEKTGKIFELIHQIADPQQQADKKQSNKL